MLLLCLVFIIPSCWSWKLISMLRDQFQGLSMGIWDQSIALRYLKYLHGVGRYGIGLSGTGCFLEWQLQTGGDRLSSLKWDWSLCLGTLVTDHNNHTLLVVLRCLRLPNCSLISNKSQKSVHCAPKSSLFCF